MHSAAAYASVIVPGMQKAAADFSSQGGSDACGSQQKEGSDDDYILIEPVTEEACR